MPLCCLTHFYISIAHTQGGRGGREIGPPRIVRKSRTNRLKLMGPACWALCAAKDGLFSGTFPVRYQIYRQKERKIDRQIERESEKAAEKHLRSTFLSLSPSRSPLSPIYSDDTQITPIKAYNEFLRLVSRPGANIENLYRPNDTYTQIAHMITLLKWNNNRMRRFWWLCSLQEFR